MVAAMNDETSAQASLAVGLCRAGRLLGSASLLFTGLSFAVLAFGDQDSLLRLVWLTVALSGMPALYLAARLAVDEAVFASLTHQRVSADAFLSAFDNVRAKLGLGPTTQTPRSLAERIYGVTRLLKGLASLLLLQILLTLLASGTE